MRKPPDRSSPGGDLSDKAPERYENLVFHSTEKMVQELMHFNVYYINLPTFYNYSPLFKNQEPQI